MPITYTVTMICDGCGLRYHDDNYNIPDQYELSAMEQEGWEYDNEKVYCPICSEARSQAQVKS